MTTGIYCLKFSSGKYYIGKSINIEARYATHISKLKNGVASIKLNKEYVECAYNLPELLIIEECTMLVLAKMESWYYNECSSHLHLLNTIAL